MSKGLEALESLYAKLSCKSSIEEIGENLQDYHIVEKELKALEIIKKHELADTLFSYLKVDKTPDNWNWGLPKKMQLTQEKWELLKEVLL